MARMLTKQQPVQISTEWFRQGYARGLKGDTRLPSVPTEEAIISVLRRVLDIHCDDGEISDGQLRYEAGLLVGYLISTVG